MKNLQKICFLLLVVLFSSCSDDDDKNSPNSVNNVPLTVTDTDGNIYNTIKIGNQIWTLENLKTTKFNDGTPINLYQPSMNWSSLTNQTSYYQWADTSDLNNAVDFDMPFDFFGAMYNHWAIESGKLAPTGWRIPTQADFQELENYLSNNGYQNQVANALKSSSGWLSSSGNGTNAVGFNGLPNGYTNSFGSPTLGNGICTWATTNVNTSLPIGSRTRVLAQLHNTNDVLYLDNSINIGSGIRCIKQ